ncbi:MAG: SMC-Scp complex subunit ScpB [Methylacidiphilaceae bacterium]|nr:SMC-Scp complex subunit ScpB [Candidatus Methylacidiphilaceae bacterium]
MRPNSEPQEVRLAPLLEAILFATREPLSSARILSILRETPTKPLDAGAEISEETVARELECLATSYATKGAGLWIRKMGGRYRMMTRPEFEPWLRRLLGPQRTPRLGPASLETLLVIAYGQPICRSEIEAIRGSAPDAGMTILAEKEMIASCGRLDAPGRPILWKTTPKFLEYIGLRRLEDLPNFEQIRSLIRPQREAPHGS